VHHIPGAVSPEPNNQLAFRRRRQICLEAFPLAVLLTDLEVRAGSACGTVKSSLIDIDVQPYPGDILRVTVKAISDAIGPFPSGQGRHHFRIRHEDSEIGKMFDEIISILEAFSKTNLKLGFASLRIGDDSQIGFNSFFFYSGLRDDFSLHFHITNKNTLSMD
jgi:hypothetical protein